MEQEGTFLTLFKIAVTLMPVSEEDTREENYRPVPLMGIDTEIIANQISIT